jgi:hypothetical protein
VVGVCEPITQRCRVHLSVIWASLPTSAALVVPRPNASTAADSSSATTPPPVPVAGHARSGNTAPSSSRVVKSGSAAPSARTTETLLSN